MDSLKLQEQNQIAAALRIFQAVRHEGGYFREMNGVPVLIGEMEHFEDTPPLADDDIDALIDRIYGVTADGEAVTPKVWTVVGFYEESMEAYADHIIAEDAYAAMAQAKCDIVVGAIPGEHQMTCPGDESGCIAATEDMPGYACAECEGPMDEGDDEICANCAATAVSYD